MAVDWQSLLIGACIPAVLAVAGFFGKRSLPSERRKAKTEELSAYATIASTMKAQGLTVDDVESVAAQFRQERRSAELQSIESDVRSNNKLSTDPSLSNYWTQASMNQRAVSESSEVESRLESVVLRYSQFLQDGQLESFLEAQAAWRTYREKQAEFVATEVEGRSLASLFHIAEMRDLTTVRVNELTVALRERMERAGVDPNAEVDLNCKP